MRGYSAIAIFLGLFIYPVSNLHPNEPLRLQLKWRHQFQFAGYYAAIEKGYYAEEGLEVILVEPESDQSTITPVIHGDAEYGISSPDLILHRAKGEPVVALASIYQHSAHAFVALEGSGMQTVHDLAGKRVMMESGVADLTALLLDEQIPLDSIQFTQHTFSESPLIQDQVDALSAYITDEPYALRQLGYQPLVFNPRSAGIDFYGDGLFTTESRTEKHPDEVAAFLRASLRGWAYALENPEEIVDLILQKYSDRKSRDALLYEAQRSIDLIRPDLINIGYMHPGRWQHMAEIYERVGLIDQPIDIHSMLYKGPTLSSGHSSRRNFFVGTSILFAIAGLYAFRQHSARSQLTRQLAEQRAAESFYRERSQEYRIFYEDAPLAFIIWDKDLRVKYWNRSAEKLFGWSIDEVKGRIAADFMIPEEAQEKVERAKIRLNEGDAHIQVNANQTKDGRTILCKWNNIPQTNLEGEVYEYHSIAIDVTVETEKMAALAEENRSIRSESLEKDQLLANTSHEIRNPLNAIMGYAQILQEDAKDEDTQEMARIMLNGAESMLKILNDLLDCSKIDVGRMELHLSSIDLREVVINKGKLFRKVIENKQLELVVHTPELPCHTVTDEFRVCQIISNLISNAAKFTERGFIEVNLEVIDEAGPSTTKYFRISVKDSGTGMDSDTLARIFEPFAQANAQIASEHGGSGLGLSLARKLAELLGGSLTASSELGQGSEFVCTLPHKENGPTQQTVAN